MAFDLQEFIRRAKQIAVKRGISHATLSKELFSTARTLPGMIEGRVSPRFSSLVSAEKKLARLEGGEATQDAAA